MLSNRSRTVTSKQALKGSLQSPTQNQSKPNSSFFGSPRFFNGFLSKGISDAEAAVMSPTSILDTKLFTNFVNPFGHDKNLSKPPNTSPQNKQLCGLALVDSLIDDKSSEDASKPNTRMILFGSKLKIQIPVTQSEISSSNSPKSPADFGIKTRNSSASGIVNSCIQTNDSPKVSTGGLSLREIELSEDYTCVISHGPIPKTTHIYDNCIVESCYGVAELPPVKKKKNFNSPSQNFLSLCHTCKKRLGEDRDIFMYGGDKAFCSYECRCKEMLYDEMSNSEFEDPFN